MHAEHHHLLFRENPPYPFAPRTSFFTLVKQQAVFKFVLTSDGIHSFKPTLNASRGSEKMDGSKKSTINAKLMVDSP